MPFERDAGHPRSEDTEYSIDSSRENLRMEIICVNDYTVLQIVLPLLGLLIALFTNTPKDNDVGHQVAFPQLPSIQFSSHLAIK